jgi:hypothetical protein
MRSALIVVIVAVTLAHPGDRQGTEHVLETIGQYIPDESSDYRLIRSVSLDLLPWGPDK